MRFETLQSIFVRSVAAIVVMVAVSMSTLSGQGAPPAQGRQGGGGRGAPAGPPPPPPDQAGHGSGKLVIWGDLVDFSRPGVSPRCFATNRFKRGQRAGFRMTAIDGGTGETEFSAQMVVHLTYGGQQIDIPMRWRGVGGFPAAEYPRQPTEQFTAVWEVPADAMVGTFAYTVTATDKFGRTTTFNPFPNHLAHFSIVE
ncbi:MAG: hypothetical protein HOP16_20375 [Acidobacteria bacterium]|nr:hypothetical protein [Acidobacteriota bacterium]